MIYPKPYSIYLRGTIGLDLRFSSRDDRQQAYDKEYRFIIQQALRETS